MFMRTTIKPYLLTRRKTADGLYPVYIRITQKGAYSLYSTEVYIERQSWNKRGNYVKKNWIKPADPSYKKHNQNIANTIEEIEQIIKENEGIDRKEIVKRLQDQPTGIDKVYEYAIIFAEKLLDEGKYHPYKQTKSSVSKFKEYAGDITFDKVTVGTLIGFQKHQAKDKILKNGNIEKGNHPNTISKTMRLLKAVFKEAKKERGYVNPFDDPDFQKVKEVQTNKKALSIEQIRQIERLKLENGSPLWHVRNYFMFSFWNAGIRFSDFSFLKWKNIKDGRLTYSMGKTGKQKDIHLTEAAKHILDYYRTDEVEPNDFIFPILPEQNLTEVGFRKKASSANVIVNRNLKELQKLAGIDTNISFHISRHSFARWANSEGLSMDFIGKALAHSKRSTTEQYLDDLSEYNLDNEMEALAGKYKEEKK